MRPDRPWRGADSLGKPRPRVTRVGRVVRVVRVVRAARVVRVVRVGRVVRVARVDRVSRLVSCGNDPKLVSKRQSVFFWICQFILDSGQNLLGVSLKEHSCRLRTNVRGLLIVTGPALGAADGAEGHHRARGVQQRDRPRRRARRGFRHSTTCSDRCRTCSSAWTAPRASDDLVRCNSARGARSLA